MNKIMNNEIEEILDNLKKHNALADEEDTYLLHYITNLQEENIKLISENETIKNIKYMVDETIYKSRIDKAIEYITKNFDKTGICVSGSDLPFSYIEELLDILQGDIK